MRDSFVFYKSFREAIKYLPDDLQLAVYNAIADYSLDGIEPELDGAAMSVFILVKPQIDANNKRFENGKKGGRKNQAETKPKPKPNQGVTNVEPNVNVNVNVNENVNENVKTARANAPQQQQSEYIAFFTNNIGLISPTIVKEADSYIKDGMSDQMVTLALKKSVDSGVKNWKYAKKILDSWLEKHINTPEQAAAEELEFAGRRSRAPDNANNPRKEKGAFVI